MERGFFRDEESGIFGGKTIMNTEKHSWSYQIPEGQEKPEGYDEIIIKDITFELPLDKPNFCLEHISLHEAIHVIRCHIDNECGKSHDERFYHIGNLLDNDFEDNEKNLCKKCDLYKPKKREI